VCLEEVSAELIATHLTIPAISCGRVPDEGVKGHPDSRSTSSMDATPWCSSPRRGPGQEARPETRGEPPQVDTADAITSMRRQFVEVPKNRRTNRRPARIAPPVATQIRIPDSVDGICREAAQACLLGATSKYRRHRRAASNCLAIFLVHNRHISMAATFTVF
jgi:hypothetical protein